MMIIIVIILILMSRSVELATKVQDVFCSCKLVAVAIIIAGGCYKYYDDDYQHYHDHDHGGDDGHGDSHGDGHGGDGRLDLMLRMAMGNYEHVATGFKVGK